MLSLDRNRGIKRETETGGDRRVKAEEVPGGEAASGQHGEGEAKVDKGLRHSIGNYTAPDNQYCGTLFWSYPDLYFEWLNPVFF